MFVDNKPKPLLIDKEYLNQRGTVGSKMPLTEKKPPHHLCKEGLYIHKSVIERFKGNRRHWKNLNDTFVTDFGFEAPAPLYSVVDELIDNVRVLSDPNSEYAGIIRIEDYLEFERSCRRDNR